MNKGAELMLHAILEMMKKKYPNAKFVMAPNLMNQKYEDRIKLGFYQKPYYWKKRIQWARIADFIPKDIRTMYGIILDKEIDVVLDASGFTYSDQWNAGGAYELSVSTNKWKENRTKVILLPQALGPFKSKKIQNYMTNAIENIDLVFARERISYEHITNAVGKRKNIKQFPDFTNLIAGVIPQDFDSIKNNFCIIPNYRMIDKVSEKESKAYLPFLIKCIKYLLKTNQKPFLLVHDTEKDFLLAKEIQETIDEHIEIIIEKNPLKIKGIIGVCEGTIGSRFHGLVSALSQGIPSLATGWSHKYQMLFDDYNFSDGLVNITVTDAELYSKIDLIINQASKQKIKKALQEKSLLLKEESRKMWNEVFKIIDEEST